MDYKSVTVPKTNHFLQLTILPLLFCQIHKRKKEHQNLKFKLGPEAGRDFQKVTPPDS